MIYAIDASVYIFRAWFSMPDTMVDVDNKPVNALYGFTRFLGDFLEKTNPDLVAVAFDQSLGTCFRNDIYPDYKANRDPAPEELKQQFFRCRQIASALGLADFSEPHFEADDLIGTVITRLREAGVPGTIVSRDKDMVQLLTAGDVLWDYAGNRRIGYADVPEAYGIRPEQMVDFLALAGDAVDNIPGVRGVGTKAASALLAHFDSLDALYSDLGAVSQLTFRGAKTMAAKLETHRDSAYLSRRLSAIHCDVPVNTSKAAVKRRSPDLGTLNHLYDHAGFGSALRRQAERIADQYDPARL
jgi:5'-3' exonuclease